MTMNTNPVILCKFNKEIFNYLSRKSIPVVYIEDLFDAGMFSSEVDHYSPVGRYTVSDLNSLAELMAVASQIKIEFPTAKRVISPNEFSQYAAAVIRSVTGDPEGSFQTTLCTRDKGLMKSTLSAGGVVVAPGFTLNNTDVEALILKIKESITYPLILKPRSAMSSQGVFKIDNEDELRWSLGCLSAEGKLRSYLCEKFIEGDEYFVDAVWTNGEEWKILVGRYEIPMLAVAQGSGLVVSRYLGREENPAVYDEIVRLSKLAVSVCGVRNSITHTEFLVDREGKVHLGEMATRMGGGPHEELAKWATGWSLGELQIRALLGDLPELAPSTLPMDTATFGYINLQPMRPGSVEQVMSADAALNHTGVLHVTKAPRGGDTFHANGSSSWFLCCILQAGNGEEFIKRSQSLSSAFYESLVMKEEVAA